MTDQKAGIDVTNIFRAAGMDARGFLPPQPCRNCGVALQGEGSGRPAELYAGTFTTLCYTCERLPAIHVATYSCGAKLWSHPPHCPSWRRDREEFRGYEGCQVCRGFGSVMVPRHNAQGGSYPENCQACWDRWIKHPPRLAAHEAERTLQEAARDLRVKLSDDYDRDRKKAAKKQKVADWTTIELPERLEHYRALYREWAAANPAAQDFDHDIKHVEVP